MQRPRRLLAVVAAATLGVLTGAGFAPPPSGAGSAPNPATACEDVIAAQPNVAGTAGAPGARDGTVGRHTAGSPFTVSAVRADPTATILVLCTDDELAGNHPRLVRGDDRVAPTGALSAGADGVTRALVLIYGGARTGPWTVEYDGASVADVVVPIAPPAACSWEVDQDRAEVTACGVLVTARLRLSELAVAQVDRIEMVNGEITFHAPDGARPDSFHLLGVSHDGEAAVIDIGFLAPPDGVDRVGIEIGSVVLRTTDAEFEVVDVGQQWTATRN